jgi:type I restriction enzyme S subunit
MKNWKSYQLGELYDISSGLSKSKDSFGYGETFISFKDVFYNWFLPSNPLGLVNSSEKDQLTCSVLKGDVLITRTSETSDEIGMTSVALKNYPKSTFNGFCKRLRIKAEAPIEISPLYIGYLFRSRNFRKTVAQYSTITTRASLNGDSIKRMSFFFPTIGEQKAIAEVLVAFDNKIENLQSQNKTMEQTAQAVFFEWFGKYQIDDELPDDWSIKKLGDIGDSIRDKVRNEKGRIVLSAISKGKLIPSDEYFTKQVYSKSLSNYIICNAGDFAYNPARINIGSIGRNNLNVNGAVSPVYVVYRTNKNYGRYVEFVLKSIRFDKHVGKFANGTVRQSLNYEGFSAFPLIIPSYKILNEFYIIIDELDKKIKLNKSQIQTLTKTRDVLLPKLMTGQLRVNGFKETSV